MIALFCISVAGFVVTYGFVRQCLLRTAQDLNTAKSLYNGNDVFNLDDLDTSHDNDLHIGGNRLPDASDLDHLGYAGFIAGYRLPAMDRREQVVEA